MKPLPSSDFRSKRFMLEKDDFALSEGEYPGPVDLINEDTWKSIVALSDDVSIRTSDRYGTQLGKMWDYWDMWLRVTGGIQALSKKPTESPTAIAVCDAGDEFQAGTYCALVGYYRVAFSCLRNVLEQVSIGAQLAMKYDIQRFNEWRSTAETVKFGWAADLLPANRPVAILEHNLNTACGDSLFAQQPKGAARRLFVELSRYTHGASGFADGDLRASNGPIFLPKAFLDWCVAALKTYAITLHVLKLAHPALDKLPWGPPPLTVNEFRRRVIADIPASDKDRAILQHVADFL